MSEVAMTSTMTRETAEGILHELNFTLDQGWSIYYDSERFRVTPPKAVREFDKFDRIIEDEAWRIARFVAYSYFASISKMPDGRYVIASRLSPTEGFEIVLEVEANELPDRRPKPLDEDSDVAL